MRQESAGQGRGQAEREGIAGTLASQLLPAAAIARHERRQSCIRTLSTTCCPPLLTCTPAAVAPQCSRTGAPADPPPPSRPQRTELLLSFMSPQGMNKACKTSHSAPPAATLRRPVPQPAITPWEHQLQPPLRVHIQARRPIHGRPAAAPGPGCCTRVGPLGDSGILRCWYCG